MMHQIIIELPKALIFEIRCIYLKFVSLFSLNLLHGNHEKAHVIAFSCDFLKSIEIIIFLNKFLNYTLTYIYMGFLIL